MKEENTINNNGYSKKEIDEILEEQKELELREKLHDLARKEDEKDQKWWDDINKDLEKMEKQQEKDDIEHWKKHGDPDQQQAKHDEKMAILEKEEWDQDVSRNYFGGVNDDPCIDYNSTYTDINDESSDKDFLD